MKFLLVNKKVAEEFWDSWLAKYQEIIIVLLDASKVMHLPMPKPIQSNLP
jgi:hypothetical protein